MPVQQITYSSSVDIRPEWGMVEQINFPALGKLSMPSMEGEEVRSCGSVQYYDKAFDRVVPKTERPLKRTQRVFRSVTTSDDPIIRYGPPTDNSCAQPTLPALRGHCMSSHVQVHAGRLLVRRARRSACSGHVACAKGHVSWICLPYQATCQALSILFGSCVPAVECLQHAKGDDHAAADGHLRCML